MPPRKTTTTSRKNYYHGNTCRTAKRTLSHTATYLCNSPKFKGLRNECQWRMGSYHNVYSQFTGTGQKTTISPTIANRWMKYVNNGVQVFNLTDGTWTKGRFFGVFTEVFGNNSTSNNTAWESDWDNINIYDMTP